MSNPGQPGLFSLARFTASRPGCRHRRQRLCQQHDFVVRDRVALVAAREGAQGHDRSKARAEPARFRVIDAAKSIDEVRAAACGAVDAFVDAQKAAP